MSKTSTVISSQDAKNCIAPSDADTNKRSKLSTENENAFPSIFTTTNFPNDLLCLVLSPFQQNEESLFVSLVCKRWHSVVKQKPISVKKVTSKYASQGTIAAIRLVRQIINNDHKFFNKFFFKNAHKEARDWALKAILDKPPSIIRAAALGFARGGHLAGLDALDRSGRILREFPICHEALIGGHRNILEWIDEVCLCPDEEDTDKLHFFAAKYGHRASIEYILSKEHNGYSWAFNGAARGGHLSIIKYLESKRFVGEDIGGFSWNAGNGGHLEIVKWTQDNYVFDTRSLAEGASAGGHLHVLKYLEEIGEIEYIQDELYTSACHAASGGRIEILKYLLEKGCQLSDSILKNALEEGQLETLKWLYGKGLQWDEKETVQIAAERGYLKTLQWALENGCKYDSKCGIGAAKYGQLRVLQFFYANGYNLSEECLTVALEESHLDVVQWLTTTCNYKLPESAFEIAIKSGDLDTVKWVYSKGFTSEEAPLIAADNGYFYILKWLQETGFIFDEKLFTAAQDAINKRDEDAWIIEEEEEVDDEDDDEIANFEEEIKEDV